MHVRIILCLLGLLPSHPALAQKNTNFNRYFNTMKRLGKAQKVDGKRFVQLHGLYKAGQGFLERLSRKRALKSDRLMAEKLADSSIEIQFSPIGKNGHSRVRIGRKTCGFGGSRSAFFSKLQGSNIHRSGVLYLVKKEGIPAAQKYFKRLTDSINRHNFPPFTMASRSLVLMPDTRRRGLFKETRGFTIINSKRKKNRFVEARLVKENGETFLEAPNGVRLPAELLADGTVTMDSQTCTSFVLSGLNRIRDKLGLPEFSPVSAARGFAKSHLDRSPYGIRQPTPDLFTVHSQKPLSGDLKQAFKDILLEKGY